MAHKKLTDEEIFEFFEESDFEDDDQINNDENTIEIDEPIKYKYSHLEKEDIIVDEIENLCDPPILEASLIAEGNIGIFFNPVFYFY